MTPHIDRLRTILNNNALDAILISSLPNITYFTDFAGFSTEDRDAFLLITNDKQYIFTHAIYTEAVKECIPSFTLVQITREQPIGEILKNICESENCQKIGIESDDLTVAEFRKLTNLVPAKRFNTNISFEDLRVIKSDNEIYAIQKACALGDTIFNEMLREITVGISEKQLKAILEYKVKQYNADISFPTIIAFGANAAHPHHVPDETILQINTFVLMDFGISLNNYVSDMTRTVMFGKADSKQKDVYKTVFEAQNKSIKFLISHLSSLNSVNNPIKASEIDGIARKYITANKYPNMPHSLGHGIGLEVHESPKLTPSSKDNLVNGMVFSIEPGIYLPGDVGVRIEDLFAIQINNLIQLTKAPRELIEL